ncbi:MAG: hypothetical protein JNG88_11835 [Phycisphaerales bacterium]|nr:hypothetical protein [Phycisphaerales bacterium]
MGDDRQPDQTHNLSPDGSTAGSQRRAPWWAPAVFLGLLLVVFAISQYISRGGAAIAWIRNDLPAALAESAKTDRRVLLVLYEPGDAIVAEHDRRLFSLRSIRETAAQFVPCRVELKPDDPLRARYGYRGVPLMVVLNANGQPLVPVQEGRVDERRFKTYMLPGSARANP